MNNPKFSRLLGPNMKLYFFVLALFVLAAFPINWILAVAEAIVAMLLYFIFSHGSKKRRARVLDYIDAVAGSVDTASKSTLINSPLPIMIFRHDTGEIIWSNEDFLQLAGVRERAFEMKIEDAVPGFSVQWLLEGKRICPERVEVHGRRFQVYGNLVRAKGKEQNLFSTTYWVDVTEADTARRAYQESRPIIAILLLDNYEDLMKACAEAQRSALLARIEEKISAWAETGNGLFLRTARDRYLYVFEERYYKHFAEEKFSILDTMRDIKLNDVPSPTLSIGIGKDAETLPELYKNANLSLEMALSRGGDQAVVRNKTDFDFYGGRAKTTEKRTKVKSRIMANALSELMADAEEIYVMGHKFADMDAVGAAIGICCAARKRGQTPHIIIDVSRAPAAILVEKMRLLQEYKDVFIDPEDAFLRMRPGALLIVVDTNRPDLVESAQALETCNRVAVIDHHRRAASYIENAAFSFHDPYASSASELVSELLQYMITPAELLPDEAEALLAGIVLDTKHFSQRTGGRTFEAAAFLRRCGADTEDVQRLFQNDLNEMVSRYDIMRHAKLYRNDIAVAAVEQENISRVTAAQAADELLTIKGVRASFVLYRSGSDVLMSARSLGDVNVQVILEQLGGGGNSTVAGGQVLNSKLQDVHMRLLAVIDAYFDEK